MQQVNTNQQGILIYISYSAKCNDCDKLFLTVWCLSYILKLVFVKNDLFLLRIKIVYNTQSRRFETTWDVSLRTIDDVSICTSYDKLRRAFISNLKQL